MEPAPARPRHEAIGHDDLLVHEWPVMQLTRLGIPSSLAQAAAGYADWHQVAKLMRPRLPVTACDQTGSVPYPMAMPEDLADTIKEVEAAGRRIVATQADVRDHDPLQGLCRWRVAKLGRLGIVPGSHPHPAL